MTEQRPEPSETGASLRDTITGERLLAPHPAYDAVELTVHTPGQGERTKPVIRHPGAVVILPLLEDGDGPPRVVLIENERIIAGVRLIELAAGGIDGDEKPEAAACRELHEETGFTAEQIEPLGSFYTSPGMSDEMMYAFVARGLTHVGQELKPWETITVLEMSAADALARVDDGTIRDGKSIAALLLAHRRGYLDGP